MAVKIKNLRGIENKIKNNPYYQVLYIIIKFDTKSN